MSLLCVSNNLCDSMKNGLKLNIKNSYMIIFPIRHAWVEVSFKMGDYKYWVIIFVVVLLHNIKSNMVLLVEGRSGERQNKCDDRIIYATKICPLIFSLIHLPSTSLTRRNPMSPQQQYNKKFIPGPKKRLTAQEYFWKKWVPTY